MAAQPSDGVIWTLEFSRFISRIFFPRNSIRWSTDKLNHITYANVDIIQISLSDFHAHEQKHRYVIFPPILNLILVWCYFLLKIRMIHKAHSWNAYTHTSTFWYSNICCEAITLKLTEWMWFVMYVQSQPEYSKDQNGAHEIYLSKQMNRKRYRFIFFTVCLF